MTSYESIQNEYASALYTLNFDYGYGAVYTRNRVIFLDKYDSYARGPDGGHTNLYGFMWEALRYYTGSNI